MANNEDEVLERVYREYWLAVLCAAEALHLQQGLIVAGGSGALAFGCAMIGTFVSPGLGTILGGAIGVACSVGNAMMQAKNKRYHRVLSLNNDQGVVFAGQLYQHYGDRLPCDLLKRHLSMAE